MLLILVAAVANYACSNGDTQSQTEARSARDGQVRTENTETQAWDSDSGSWVGIETFWQNYANRRGGLTWGSGTEYPPYPEVSELDTFLVQLDSGPCLMEFFHSRWRRANDVRRWDPAFNEFGGCPHVFD